LPQGAGKDNLGTQAEEITTKKRHEPKKQLSHGEVADEVASNIGAILSRTSKNLGNQE